MNKIQQNIKKYLPLFGQQWSKFNNYELYKLSLLNSSTQVVFELGIDFNSKHAPTSCQYVKRIIYTVQKPITAINRRDIEGFDSLEIELKSENKFLFAMDEVESFYSKSSIPEIGDLIKIEGKENLFLVLKDSHAKQNSINKYIKIANVFNHKGSSSLQAIDQSSTQKLNFHGIISYKKYYLTKLVKIYVLFSILILMDIYISNRKKIVSILPFELHSIVSDPFETYSISQIVGGCLDWVREILVILVGDYLESGNPIIEDKLDIKKHQDWDILGLISFFINNYSNITNIIQMNDPPLGRTMLFLIKNNRNRWAHQHPFDLRDTYRICDTIEMFLTNINDSRFASYIVKLTLIRENCCLRMAHEIYEKNNHNSQGNNFNQHNHNLDIESNTNHFQNSSNNSNQISNIQNNNFNFSQFQN